MEKKLIFSSSSLTSTNKKEHKSETLFFTWHPCRDRDARLSLLANISPYQLQIKPAHDGVWLSNDPPSSNRPEILYRVCMMPGIDVSLASENILPTTSYAQSTMELLHQQEFANHTDSEAGLKDKKTKKRKKTAEEQDHADDDDDNDDEKTKAKKQKKQDKNDCKPPQPDAPTSETDESLTIHLKSFFAVLQHAKLMSQTAFCSMSNDRISIHTTQSNRKYELVSKATHLVTVTQEPPHVETQTEIKHSLLATYSSVLKPKKTHNTMLEFTFDWERWLLKSLKVLECKWAPSSNDIVLVHVDAKSLTLPRKKKGASSSSSSSSSSTKFARQEVSAATFSEALQCMDKSVVWKWNNKDWRILANLHPSSKCLRVQRVRQQKTSVILRHDNFQVAAAPVFYDNYVCTDECMDIVLGSKHGNVKEDLFLLRPATQLFKRYGKKLY